MFFLPTDENSNDDITNLEPSEVSTRIILSNTKRRIVYEALLEKTIDGKLNERMTKLVTSQFLVPICIVQRIWKFAENKWVHLTCPI